MRPAINAACPKSGMNAEGERKQSPMKNTRESLLANIGQQVTIENDAFQNDISAIGFNAAGVLEDSGGGNFFVRTGEDYFAGATGINFRESHVLEAAERKSGGLRIVLKSLPVA